MDYIKQYRQEAGLLARNNENVQPKHEPKSPTPTKQSMMYLNNQQGISRQRRSTSGFYASTNIANFNSVFKTPLRQASNLTQSNLSQTVKKTTPRHTTPLNQTSVNTKNQLSISAHHLQPNNQPFTRIDTNKQQAVMNRQNSNKINSKKGHESSQID